MPTLKTAACFAGKIALILFWAALLAVIPAGLSRAGVMVIFPPENTAQGSRLILGDVATVTPDSENDQALADLVSAVDLGPSPSAGEDLILRRRQLEQRLSTSGAPISELRWLIPDEVKFTGASVATDETLVKKIITEYLDRSEPYTSGQYDLLSLNYSTPPALPHGQVEYRFTPQSSSNPAYLTGTIFFTVNGQQAGRLRVTAQVDLRIPAIVVVRDLPRNHVLAEEDLTETMVSFAQAKGALTEIDRVVGQTLKTTVRAGAPVRDRDLVATSMVKKGEIVTIIAQNGNLKISAIGQARQDGALGQTISVVNQDSKKTISAKVIGPGMVEVIF
ncbi:MAG: flagellar basal body P-ring formation chaperone FlgA [Deltaproteobacteria bacterium]|jgi:flagella basal body P-ring formation protein FlgA|nr:flagellar basal body P-ring formation chaperone FlgA [Deltaproteobacteria bacterium]